MAVPGPRTIHQDEAVPRIAELFLQQTTHGARDAVIRNRRIAVMRDARDCAGLFGIGAGERGVKRVERIGRVFNRMLRADDDGVVNSG